MEPFPLDYPCPPWLEDEALLIEHAGEMPEVALAESLHILQDLPPEDLRSLRAACARGYMRNIQRDLNPDNIGSPAFRGLERAWANLTRLERFWAGLKAELPPAARQDLASALAEFMQSEQRALDQGRIFAAACFKDVIALAGALELDMAPWLDFLQRIKNLPAPDFIGLRALQRLNCPNPASKRRRLRGGQLLIELLDSKGGSLARAALPWHSDAPAVAAENRARAEMIWQLIDAQEERGADPDPGGPAP